MKKDALAQALAFFDRADAGFRAESVPEGFFTARQIAEKRGVLRAQCTKEKLDRMVRLGQAECRMFRVGRNRTAHYKILVK